MEKIESIACPFYVNKIMRQVVLHLLAIVSMAAALNGHQYQTKPFWLRSNR